MRDLIRPDASFTPRELFARMQGAWFEPRQGYMWQEDTGVTPTTTGGQTIGKLVDLSADRVASQATAANRPILQFTGNLPLIRHADSTDVLAAAMPAINVRRNLLTYSEQFDNAAWTTVLDQTVGASYLIDKNIYAQTLIANSAAYSHRKQAFTAVVGNIYTASIHIKKTGSKSYNALFQANIGLSKYCAVLINTYTGVCTVVTGGIYNAPSVTPITVDKNDCWRVSLTFAPLASGIEIQIYSSVNASGGSLTGPSAGDNAFGGVQLELGSVATDYQKITDWTSEQYSSAGSVYFSTPQGMSCLHNQSIGTSYNLPALQTDIYGTVITPARLAPPLEQRLALYMHRLAGLSDADFFWQEQATDGMTGQLLADDNDTILLRA